MARRGKTQPKSSLNQAFSPSAFCPWRKNKGSDPRGTWICSAWGRVESVWAPVMAQELLFSNSVLPSFTASCCNSRSSLVVSREPMERVNMDGCEENLLVSTCLGKYQNTGASLCPHLTLVAPAYLCPYLLPPQWSLSFLCNLDVTPWLLSPGWKSAEQRGCFVINPLLVL